MAKEYVPIFFDWTEVTEELNAQEKGRLIDAIVLYAQGGNWQEQIKGNERYLFPAFKKQIDRGSVISETKAANGSKGGKQNEANRSKRKQTEANASKPKQTQANASEEEKEEEKEEEYIKEKIQKEKTGGYFGLEIDEDTVHDHMVFMNKVEDACIKWGLPCKPGNLEMAVRLAETYSQDWLFKAVERCGSGKSQTWAYVEGILKNWKEAGGPEKDGEKSNCRKSVSAQNYTQREYTEADLDNSGDLFAEIKARRAAQ